MVFPRSTYTRAKELPVGTLRNDMARYLRQLEMLGHRYLITRHGRAIGALVLPGDLHALEDVELRSKEEFEHRAQRVLRNQLWLAEAREKATDPDEERQRRAENGYWSSL